MIVNNKNYISKHKLNHHHICSIKSQHMKKPNEVGLL